METRLARRYKATRQIYPRLLIFTQRECRFITPSSLSTDHLILFHVRACHKFLDSHCRILRQDESGLLVSQSSLEVYDIDDVILPDANAFINAIEYL